MEFTSVEDVMPEQLSFAKRPVVLTHWDPDVYPYRSQPLPPIQELLVHVLAYGEVRIKDVDLFLNPRIRSCFSDDAMREQLASLLGTGRVRVLLPPKSTKFDIDPTTAPLTAVALERVRNERPFKDQPWQFTRPIKRYCQTLDDVITQAQPEAKAIRFRAEFPVGENTFAKKLADVLRVT